MSEARKYRYQITIETTQEQLWHAITSSELTQRWYFNSPLFSDWTPGSTYVQKDGDQVLVEGINLEEG